MGANARHDAISGQGGGRKIPGTSYAYDPLNIGPGETTLVSGYIVLERFSGLPGGAFGQAGVDAQDVTYTVYPSGGGAEDTFDNNPVVPGGGGGGGWGAKGGDGSDLPASETYVPLAWQNPAYLLTGASGGKAINTNGNSVTWVSGSTRAYGVVG